MYLFQDSLNYVLILLYNVILILITIIKEKINK